MNGYVRNIKKFGKGRKQRWIVEAVISGNEFTVTTSSLKEAKEILALAGCDWVVV